MIKKMAKVSIGGNHDKEGRPKGEIESKATLSIEPLADQLGLASVQAALSIIPIAGPFVATYFGELRGRRSQERAYKYINYVREMITEIDRKKLDNEYLRSEEFAELLAKGADLASKSVSEQRIKRLANILANQPRLDFEFRQRTESIIDFVNRLSDLDAFALMAYRPSENVVRADSKAEVVELVRRLALFLGQSIPDPHAVIESIVYLDNLGLTWVNEKNVGAAVEKGEGLILKEFSSFRTPLGSEVVRVMLPHDFFRKRARKFKSKFDWPFQSINPKYCHTAKW